MCVSESGYIKGLDWWNLCNWNWCKRALHWLQFLFVTESGYEKCPDWWNLCNWNRSLRELHRPTCVLLCDSRCWSPRVFKVLSPPAGPPHTWAARPPPTDPHCRTPAAWTRSLPPKHKASFYKFLYFYIYFFNWRLIAPLSTHGHLRASHLFNSTQVNSPTQVIETQGWTEQLTHQ